MRNDELQREIIKILQNELRELRAAQISSTNELLTIRSLLTSISDSQDAHREERRLDKDFQKEELKSTTTVRLAIITAITSFITSVITAVLTWLNKH